MTVTKEDLLKSADRYRFFSHAFRYPDGDVLGEFLEELKEAWPEAENLRESLNRDRDRLPELYMPLMKGEIPLSRVSYTLQVAADLQGLYRVFGVQPRGGENPDALPLVLEFAAFMQTKEALAPDSERAEITREGYRKLLEDLLRWIPTFATRVQERLPETFYARCALALQRSVEEEASRIGIPG